MRLWIARFGVLSATAQRQELWGKFVKESTMINLVLNVKRSLKLRESVNINFLFSRKLLYTKHVALAVCQRQTSDELLLEVMGLYPWPFVLRRCWEDIMAVVLVTGSSRGIGFSIAHAFAREGHTVVLNGREDTERLAHAVEELRNNYSGNVMGICADLSYYSAAQEIFAKIEAAYGPVEILVNNAGAAHFGLFSDMSPMDTTKVLADNLHTTINASHLAMPHMVRAKAGCIINITSIWGVAGASCEVVYSAAKAGVIGLTKALAKEVGPSGVRVNAIACGAFETRMNDRLTAQEKAGFVEGIPLGRFGKPQEVGDLAVFLASEKAGYLTGQVIILDGGTV